MKYRVHYLRYDQVGLPAKWENREKDFPTLQEARHYANSIYDNVAVRILSIQPVP